MHTVNMHEAKSSLSRLVEEAVAGEDVIIAKAGTPLVKLVPLKRDTTPREPGKFKGKITLSKDFEKTPEDVVSAFEGE